MDYYSTALAFDQERIEKQDAAAIELHTVGVTDGYFGNKPETDLGFEYLRGYLAGIKHKQLEIKLQAQLLDYEGRRLESEVGIFEEF